jgi:hypothetical protein
MRAIMRALIRIRILAPPILLGRDGLLLGRAGLPLLGLPLLGLPLLGLEGFLGLTGLGLERSGLEGFLGIVVGGAPLTGFLGITAAIATGSAFLSAGFFFTGALVLAMALAIAFLPDADAEDEEELPLPFTDPPVALLLPTFEIVTLVPPAPADLFILEPADAAALVSAISHDKNIFI